MTRWSKSFVITTGQPRRAASPSIDLYTAGAPGAYTTADVEPPSSRDAAWGGGVGIIAADMHRGTWKACRKLSENQTQLDPRAAPPSALRPPPSLPRACGPPTLKPARVRVASSRDGAGGSEWGGKELRGWRRTSVPWAPREPMTVPWSKVGGRRALPRSPLISLDLESSVAPWGRRPGSRGCAHRAGAQRSGASEAGRSRSAAFRNGLPLCTRPVKACPTYNVSAQHNEFQICTWTVAMRAPSAAHRGRYVIGK